MNRVVSDTRLAPLAAADMLDHAIQTTSYHIVWIMQGITVSPFRVGSRVSTFPVPPFFARNPRAETFRGGQNRGKRVIPSAQGDHA